mgnify:FL=1
MAEYYISLDSQNGTQLDDSQANIEWDLGGRALPRGAKMTLVQFNFNTSSATGFSGQALNGVLIDSPFIGNKFKSFVSKTNDKPVQSCVLACIPNETLLNTNATEKLSGSYEPYNLLDIHLPEHQEIYKLELRLKDPDSLSPLTLNDDLDWSVLLKITLP